MESLKLYEYAWLVPLLPLLASMIVGVGLISFNQATNKLRQINSIFIISVLGVALNFGDRYFFGDSGKEMKPYIKMIEWASAGDFTIRMGYTIDHLSALMMVIVCTVALLVMIYTDGYMAHDEGYVRFYAYLSIFSSSMLGLVISPQFSASLCILGVGRDVFLLTHWLLVRS